MCGGNDSFGLEEGEEEISARVEIGVGSFKEDDVFGEG